MAQRRREKSLFAESLPKDAELRAETVFRRDARDDPVAQRVLIAASCRTLNLIRSRFSWTAGGLVIPMAFEWTGAASGGRCRFGFPLVKSRTDAGVTMR